MDGLFQGFPIFLLGYHLHLGVHLAVIVAAVFGAEKVVEAFFGCVEPHVVVAAWNHVTLRPERGDVEAVKDVVGPHDHLDIAIDWKHQQRQLFDGGVFHGDHFVFPPVFILECPLPFLGRHIHVDGTLGNPRHVEISHGSFPEDPYNYNGRNHGPSDFDRRVVKGLGGAPIPWSFPVHPHEVSHRDHDRDEKYDANPEDDRKKEVHLWCKRRSAFREPCVGSDLVG